ncbi:MAG: dienelactone hydrolase family protein [Gammaproteobacteria bacterium]|nr:dienelactone hydrolase family protein [Gammaproteobacteria bacterium]
MSASSVIEFIRAPVTRPWGIAAVLLLAIVLFVYRGGLHERAAPGVAWVAVPSYNLDPGALYAEQALPASNQQILARLSLPDGEGPFPAVVLLHGSLGYSALQRRYADALNEHGYVVLAVDSFSARDVVDVVGRQQAVSIESMVADSYAALRLLRSHPQVAGNAIALLGWSKGGTAAIAAGRTAYRERLSSDGDRFSAIGAVYPWCGARERVMRRDDVPVLLVLAGADDWVSADACADLLAEMATLGLRARVAIYDDAEHGFDAPGIHRVFLPRGRSWHRCHYAADAQGFTVMATAERRPWSDIDAYLEDCTTRGVHVATNAGDRAEARQRVLRFLAFTIGNDRIDKDPKQDGLR